jgi:DEAD/DEAH box helicase
MKLHTRASEDERTPSLVTDPVSMFEDLKRWYLRYYETPFGVRDHGVEAERRQLLETPRAIHQIPYLEPIPGYATSAVTLTKLCGDLGISTDLANYVASTGAIPKGPDGQSRLYKHQEQSLRAAFSGRHPVLTAGTGSGKTEAFLLPVLASLIQESVSWGPNVSDTSTGWWRDTNYGFVSQRAQERGRAAAIRVLILYPMNALVEDQLQRLRQLFDSPEAREWMDANRGGHRFYFGRYTGPTPVSGGRNPAKMVELRSFLVEAEARAQRVANDPARRRFVAQLDGAEMRSRWDMQDTPPDVLITNYSMLNIMLMRQREETMFDATRAWLRQSNDHVLHVIVDELHSYRGTAGTEVALMLRTFLDRLGLHGDSSQVKFLAASASLSGDGIAYLEGFFASDRPRFEVIPGEPLLPLAGPSDLSAFAESLRAATAVPEEDLDRVQVAQLLDSADARDSVLRACLSDGTIRPQSVTDLAQQLFGASDNPEQSLSGLLRALAVDRRLPMRAHYFFRNVMGIWACANPGCSRVAPEFRSEDRRVGRLFVQPQIRCDCGGRVLDLMYCQTCGDLFLGGFRSPDPDSPGTAWQLVPDLPNLDGLPDEAQLERRFGNYAVVWPRPDAEPVDIEWRRSGGDVQYRFQFKRAKLEPLLGKISLDAFDSNAWLFHVSASSNSAQPQLVPAAPTKCPSCDDDWEIAWTGRMPDDPDRSRSPIRLMRTDFEKVGQVLSDSLVRALGASSERRKLIVFSDSRQDAAKLSAGLEKRHYQDTVRQLLASAARNQPGSEDLDYFIRYVRSRVRDDLTRTGYRRFVAAWGDAAESLRQVLEGEASEEDERAAAELLRRIRSDHRPLAQLRDSVQEALLFLGMNPGGPDSSIQSLTVAGVRTPWEKLFRWDAPQPHALSGAELTEEERRHLEMLSTRLLQELQRAIFARTSMDFESIGLGWATVDPSYEAEGPGGREFFRSVLDGVVRLHGDRNRFMGGSRPGGMEVPGFLKRYARKVAEVNGFDEQELVEAIELALNKSAVATQSLLNPVRLFVRPPRAEAWICARCRRQHLHPAGGVCTSCLAELPSEPVAVHTEENYYAALSLEGGDAFRLHAEELTGQTDRVQALAR